MRKKTIAAIFSVYFVICAAYGISRSMAQTESAQQVQTAQQQTTAQTSTTTQQTPAQTTTKTTTQTVTDDDDDTPHETVTSPAETTITEQTQPDVPSLDEYLSKLRCSGCRHNCSLANPRCMNGRRKASSAESEYYSLYG